MLSSEDMLDEFVTWFADVKRARESSVVQYRSVLKKYVEQVGDLSVVTPERIEVFLLRPRAYRGTAGGVPAAATIARDRTIVSSFHKFLQRRGWRADNPVEMTGAPMVRNADPQAIDDSTWMRLWSSRMPREDRLWLGLGAFVGLRRWELNSLNAGHFDVHQGMIRDLERKGGSRTVVEYADMVLTVGQQLPQVLPDPQGFLDLVEWAVRVRSDEPRLVYWATSSRNPQAANRALHRVLTQAGISPDSCRPHSLRHTCATNLLRCGVPIEIVADQLNHRDIQTTRRYLKTAGQLGRWLQERHNRDTDH